MRTFPRRRSRPAAWALIVALTLAFVVNCVPEADATPAQTACCVAMAHDCGAASIEQSCCASEVASLESLAAKTPVAVSAPPAAAFVCVFAPPSPLFSRASLVTSVRLVPVKPPKIPTYLLVSTFRI